MTTRAGTGNLAPYPLIAAVLALGLLAGCDGGGQDVDRATVTVQEPGEAILGDASPADTIAAPPVEEAQDQP